MTTELGHARWAVTYEGDKAAYRAVMQWDVDGGMYGVKVRRTWRVVAMRLCEGPGAVLAGIDAALAWAG